MINFKSYLQETPEERRKTGVYVSAKFTPESANKLAEWCVSHLIPSPTNLTKYHSTIVYSRTDVPEADKLVDDFVKLHQKIKLQGERFELFDSKGGPTGNEKKNVLVLVLKAPKLTKLHELLKKHGASHDYEEYHPHVTLSYEVPDGFDYKSLPLPDVELEVSDITAQPLDRNWNA